MDSYLLSLDRSQRHGLTVLASNEGGAIWHRVGTGKTRITYAWFATIAKSIPKGVIPYFIVVCRREAFGDWIEEAEKMGLDFIVVNYEKYCGKNQTNSPRIFLLSHGILARTIVELIENYGLSIQAITFDEGFLYKNKNTKHCKAANQLVVESGADACILSGSIMTARNLEDVYGQLFAINKHHILGRTLTDFRSRYMFDLHITVGDRRIAKGMAKRNAVVEINQKIKEFTSFYFPESPRKHNHITRTISPSVQQAKLFAELKREFFLEHKEGWLDIKSQMGLIAKCQQISDGWLQLTEGGKIEVKSAKYEYLLAQLTELVAEGEKVLVLCTFRHTVEILLQLLQKTKLHVYGFSGSRKFDAESWKRNGQVAVGTQESASSVNHFAQCAYGIYYSMSPKWLALQQSRGRTDRKNSEHKTCWYYYLQTTGSLDATVMRAALNSGKKEQELISEGIRKWLE